MPQLVPVEGDPFLQPVEGDPFAEGMTLKGNVAEVAKKLETEHAGRLQTLSSLAARYTLPGRVAAGIQPETPGIMTEEDAFRQNQLEAEAQGWGPEQAAAMLKAGVSMAGKGTLGSGGGGIKAYHGSPYDFDRFDVGKIGSGEGAQAYGHGLYFAENPQTAKSYREALTRTSGNAALDWSERNPGIAQEARQQLNAHSKSLGIDPPDDNMFALMLTMTKEGHPPDGFTPELANSIKQSWEKPPGRMYEVNINADPEHFLDWDKPLSEQHPKVQEALKGIGQNVAHPPELSSIRDPEIRSVVRRALKQNEGQAQGLDLVIDNDRALYDASRKHAARSGRDLDNEDVRASEYVYQQAKPFLDALHHSQNMSGEKLVQQIKGSGLDQAAASDALHKAGIPGIKYLDQGSRGEGEGTHNYVVFHHSIVDILKKYGLAGLVAGGAAHFKTQPHEGDPFADSQ